MNVAAVERAISIPVSDWPGNCYAIACSMIDAGLTPGGKKRYGHWLGPIAEHTMFSCRSLVSHGWIEMPDSSIIDPTRWVFEGVDPYIFQDYDTPGYYDVGGNVLRTAMAGPPPVYTLKDKQYEIPETEAAVVLRQILGGHEGATFSWPQLMYVANLQPRFAEEDIVTDVYRWLRDIGLKALIPIDNWDLIMKV